MWRVFREKNGYIRLYALHDIDVVVNSIIPYLGLLRLFCCFVKILSVFIRFDGVGSLSYEYKSLKSGFISAFFTNYSVTFGHQYHTLNMARYIDLHVCIRRNISKAIIAQNRRYSIPTRVNICELIVTVSRKLHRATDVTNSFETTKRSNIVFLNPF